MKANRISRKAPTNKGNAQGGRAVSKSTKGQARSTKELLRLAKIIDTRGTDAERAAAWRGIAPVLREVLGPRGFRSFVRSHRARGKSEPPKLPYHKALPRSDEELRGFHAFTGNLGTRLASCVKRSGFVEHLFQRGDDFFRVWETTVFTKPKGVLAGAFRLLGFEDGGCISIDDVLEVADARLEDVLAEAGAQWRARSFDFEVLTRKGAALWVEKTETAAALSHETKVLLWGYNEVEKRIARHVLRFSQHEDGKPVFYDIYARAGQYELQNEATGSPKPMSRREVETALREYQVWPALTAAVPDSFRENFLLNYRDLPSDPAKPGDVVNG